MPVAATCVRERLPDRIELRSNEVGDFAFFEGVGRRGGLPRGSAGPSAAVRGIWDTGETS